MIILLMKSIFSKLLSKDKDRP
jgi:hypothetical protein